MLTDVTNRVVIISSVFGLTMSLFVLHYRTAHVNNIATTQTTKLHHFLTSLDTRKCSLMSEAIFRYQAAYVSFAGAASMRPNVGGQVVDCGVIKVILMINNVNAVLNADYDGDVT